MMHVEDVIILPDKKMTEDVDITYGETEKKKKSLVTLLQNGFASSLRPFCYGLFVRAHICVQWHLVEQASRAQPVKSIQW